MKPISIYPELTKVKPVHYKSDTFALPYFLGDQVDDPMLRRATRLSGNQNVVGQQIQEPRLSVKIHQTNRVQTRRTSLWSRDTAFYEIA